MGITYTAAAESAANNYMENGVTVCITGTVYKTITFSLQESSTGVEGTIIVKEGDDNDLYKCTTRDSFIVEELLKLKVGDSINVGGSFYMSAWRDINDSAQLTRRIYIHFLKINETRINIQPSTAADVLTTYKVLRYMIEEYNGGAVTSSVHFRTLETRFRTMHEKLYPQVPFDDLHIETKYYEPPEDFDNHE